MVLVKAVDEQAAFLVDEAHQVGLAQRIAGVFQDARRRARRGAGVMPHDVAHDADVDEVDRVLRGLPYVHDAAIVLGIEVDEIVQSAAGEEHFPCRRILAAHRGVEQGIPLDAGLAQQGGGHPLRQHVALRLGLLPERLGVERAVVVVQIRDDLQIGDQGAQLGGGAEIQPRLAVDVERLVEVVGLNAQHIAQRRFLVQGEAVDHLAERVVGLQQTKSDQARRCGGFGVGQALQVVADDLLRRLVDGGVDLQIQAVEVVQARFAEQLRDADALGVGGFLVDETRGRRIDALVRAAQPDLLGAVGEFARNHVRVGQQVEMVVGQGIERLAVGGQVVRRTTFGDDQRQHVLQRARIGSFAGVLAFSPGSC